jgi:CO dehydrogenase maturation factor
MGSVIVIAGKGGTGKTTLASLLVRALKENKRGSILAVDADPNSNLAEALGIKVSETIADIIDDVKDKPQEIPQGISKDRFIEYRIQTSIVEGEGFDLLTMGRPEGPGCYCYVNNVLRDNLGRLIKEYDLIVIDNAAGLEHLSRRLSSSADFFLIVSDATQAGLRAAAKIHQLRQELKIKVKKEFLIVNRAKNSDVNSKKLEDSGLNYLGEIPEDEQIMNLSLNGSSLLDLEVDSLAFKSIVELERKLWQRN